MPSLVADILLLLQIFIPRNMKLYSVMEIFNLPSYLGQFPKLQQDFSEWNGYDNASTLFLEVSNFYPLLTLHYWNFLFIVNLNAASLVSITSIVVYMY